jgi:hypothetical protein
MKFLTIVFALMLSTSVLACGGDKMDDSDQGKKKKQSQVSE